MHQKIMVIFIIWIVFILLEQKKDLNFIKEFVKKKEDFYNIVMPSEDINTLEINQNQKSNKASFIIKADL